MTSKSRKIRAPTSQRQSNKLMLRESEKKLPKDSKKFKRRTSLIRHQLWTRHYLISMKILIIYRRSLIVIHKLLIKQNTLKMNDKKNNMKQKTAKLNIFKRRFKMIKMMIKKTRKSPWNQINQIHLKRKMTLKLKTKMRKKRNKFKSKIGKTLPNDFTLQKCNVPKWPKMFSKIWRK